MKRQFFREGDAAMEPDRRSLILLVDDDEEIRQIARVLLQNEGYHVLEAADGQQALDVFSDDVDLVILDVLMPGMDGYQVCIRLRQRSNVPILFLTAKSQDADLTYGFASGGDDYLSKPFSYAELIARVKGLLRRYKVYKGDARDKDDRFIEWRDIRLDREQNNVRVRGREVGLTETAYQILRLLMLHQGQTISAQAIYESVWEAPYFASTSNTVMVHIRRLREKIEVDPQNPRILKTVWGKGYRIE